MCMIVVDGLFKSITRNSINRRIVGVNKFWCCCCARFRASGWMNVPRVYKIANDTQDQHSRDDTTYYHDTLPLDSTLPLFFTPSLLFSTPLVFRCLACRLPTCSLILPRRLIYFLFISRLYLL